MSEFYLDEEFEEGGRPNKSLLKREAKSLQSLASQLGEMEESVWSSFGFSSSLCNELSELKRIKQFGAKKRQMKRVAKLLRDADLDQVNLYLDGEQFSHAASNLRFHQVEQWRDRLVEEEGALTEFMSQYPGADIQHLRQLVRNAKRELENNLAPKSARIIFKYIRDIID